MGLAAGARRRTPGLRREEVARLAGMSVDYYARLEQARGARPSRQMLAALARALRLTPGERDHLVHLAGGRPPREPADEEYVRPGLLLILDRLHDTPAMVVNDIGDVLAQNAMSAALFGDVSDRPPGRRNLVRRVFTDPGARAAVPAEDYEPLARSHVAQLRAVVAARPKDVRPAALAAELRSASPLFARMWAEHEVAVRRTDVKRLLHPVVGELVLDCEEMLSPDGEQRLVVLTARPGSGSCERLRLLQVVGLQDLSVG